MPGHSLAEALETQGAEGRTVVAAAGDTGSTGCYGDGATNSGGLLRELPDISADGDSSTGCVGCLSGAWSAGWGGTSMSATVVAAMAVLIDASPFCSAYGAGNAGLLPQALYGLVATDPSYVYGSSPDQEPASR